MLNILLIFSLFSFAAEEETQPLNTENSFEKRLREENKTTEMDYTFLAHKPFYILPFTHNSSPSPGSLTDLSTVDEVEVKLQFSFKVHAIESFYNDYFQLSFAYTNLAFWQLYNTKNSSPFRETNHEPEIFLTFFPDKIRPATSKSFFRLGFTHESNGQNVPQSRSWNRLYVSGTSSTRWAVLNLKVWYRLPESPKLDPESPKGDDNPGITDYMGFFEFRTVSKIHKSTLTAMWRNNLKSDNRGAIELNWSFPINGPYKGYVQYFNGYGESLIDYRNPSQRIGLGILMGDWL